MSGFKEVDPKSILGLEKFVGFNIQAIAFMSNFLTISLKPLYCLLSQAADSNMDLICLLHWDIIVSLLGKIMFLFMEAHLLNIVAS